MIAILILLGYNWEKELIEMDMAISSSMTLPELQQNISISVTKKAMDSMEDQATSLLEMLPPPPTNYLIDVRA